MADLSYVDFNAVPTHQRDIDARLVNWARWCFNRPASNVSPMFRLYRSTDASQQYGEVAANPVDAIDAQAVQKAVSALPSRHRLAISWCYIRRSNPRRAAQDLGESLSGLCALIVDGRQMLINRER